jgi:DNA-binding transcriptional LysR family regulator
VEGTLRLGMSASTAAHSFSSDVIRAYRRAYPGIALELQENNAGNLAELTARRHLDVIMLRWLSANLPGFRFEHLLQEEMVVVLPRNHPLLKHGGGSLGRITLRQLAGERFVFSRITGSRPGVVGMYANLRRACERAGFTPHVVAEVEHMGSVINLVAAEVGISIVPASVRGVHADDVIYHRLDSARDLNAPIKIAYLADNRNPAALNFITLAHKRATAFKRRKAR